jgi:hypothetical protein
MPKGINRTIRQLAESQTNWRFHTQANLAYRLYDAMNARLFNGTLPDPLISFDETGRLKKDGDYQWERDGLALYGRMDLRRDLSQLELAVAVIHNLEHLSQETFSKNKKSWYHSAAFRKRMKGFGIQTNTSGDTVSMDGTFYEMLLGLEMGADFNASVLPSLVELATFTEAAATPEQIAEGTVELETSDAVEVPASLLQADTLYGVPTVLLPKPKGTSKMKKWSCSCTNIRAAVLVWAICLACAPIKVREFIDYEYEEASFNDGKGNKLPWYFQKEVD